MNVILYILDALRPDFLGCYGFTKNTSPNIDALARDSVLYGNAYSTTTWTKASAASIVTSQYPRSLNMMHQMDVMPNYEGTLPKVLRKNGFQTHGISANVFFSPFFGFSGFDKFFNLQMDDELQKKRRKAEALMGWAKMDKLTLPLSEDINEKIFPILEDKKRDGNKFIMIWSLDTHGPYYVQGSKSYFGNSTDNFILESDVGKHNLEKVKSLYCDMIRYNDFHLGKLVSKLKKEGLYEDSLIIVIADHGDSFGDHKTIRGRPIIGHIGMVYEEVIKVPLIIKYPKNKFAGERYKMPVQLVDIYPTILDICGIKYDTNKVEGVSLNPMRKKINNDRIIFVESQITPEHVYSAAIRVGNWKLIKIENKFQISLNWRKLAGNILHKLQVPAIQFYDLSTDRKEKRNLYKRNKEQASIFLKRYYEVKSTCDKRAKEIKTQHLKESTKRRIKRLKKNV
jgi:arylsulfatase A-like enzyme